MSQCFPLLLHHNLPPKRNKINSKTRVKKGVPTCPLTLLFSNLSLYIWRAPPNACLLLCLTRVSTIIPTPPHTPYLSPQNNLLVVIPPILFFMFHFCSIKKESFKKRFLVIVYCSGCRPKMLFYPLPCQLFCLIIYMCL